MTATLLTLATLVILPDMAQVSHAAPKIFTVNTTDDTVDSSGCNTQHCSIRKAIIKANSTGDLDYVYDGRRTGQRDPASPGLIRPAIPRAKQE